MTRPAAIAILDMDGVHVDLHLDGQRVRRALNAILASQGLSVDGQGLLAGIAAACAKVGAKNPTAGGQLAEQLWAVIDEEETRCSRVCSIHPGALALLDRLSHLPVALFTNNPRACALAVWRQAMAGCHSGRPNNSVTRPGS